MKKWLYVISVGSLTAIFLAFYLTDRKAADIREKEHKEIAAKKAADELKKKDEDKAKAQKDAQDRDRVRREEEAKKEADKRQKWEDVSKKIQDDTNVALARGDKAAKEAARLELELDALRKSGEKLSRETFDMAKRVERAEAERQAAEMEIQRTVEWISKHAAESAMTRMPAPPVMAAPAK
jgi:hypothetical protein